MKRNDGPIRKPEVAEDEQTRLAEETSAGFGKNINDYLNLYVTVADAKAGAVLAVDLAMVAVILDKADFSKDVRHLLAGSIGMFAISAAAGVIAIFPRLPSGGESLIFWEDIRGRPLAEYAWKIARMSASDIETEFAIQNWYVSRVLHKKMRLVQVTIVFLFAGLALACAFGILR